MLCLQSFEVSGDVTAAMQNRKRNARSERSSFPWSEVIRSLYFALDPMGNRAI